MDYSKYYGAKVGKKISRWVDERLTRFDDDLVKAHLQDNYAYFGSIDKTLAGFVVLDDEGDNYLLYDLREKDGGIWFQDHETRECWLRFASLAKWRAYSEELAKHSDDEDFDDDALYHKSYRPKGKAKRAKQVPSSAELLKRYQWLMWLFAQPMRKGFVDQSPPRFAESAVGHLEAYWKNEKRCARTFKKELPLLAKDPHLAIYWLLHAAILVELERLEAVRKAIAKVNVPLVRAFDTTFGELALDGKLKVLKDFAARRSYLLLLRALGEKDELQKLLQAMRVDHRDGSWLKARAIAVSADKADGWQLVRESIGLLRGSSPGRSLLQARLDLLDGKDKSPHAHKALAGFLKKNSEEKVAGYALHAILPLLRSDSSCHELLLPVGRRLVELDPYYPPYLEIALVAEPPGAHQRKLKSRLADLRSIGKITDGLSCGDASKQGKALSKVKKLSGAEQLLLARTVLAAPGDFYDKATPWAFDRLLASKEKDRVTVLSEALPEIDESDHEGLLRRVKKMIQSAKSPEIALLLAIVRLPEAEAKEDFLKEMTLGELKEQALIALGPYAAHPKIFEQLMAILGDETLPLAREHISNELLYPKGRYSKHSILARLSDKQARSAARGLIAMARADEQNSLYYFNHKGAEAVLIEALNQQETVPCKDPSDLALSLYSAVKNMKTPRAYTAILERLFAEERQLSWLGDAVKDIFNAKIHKQALTLITKRARLDAANRYAAALVEEVQQPKALVELTAAVLPLTAKKPAERALKKYVLLEGAAAALEAGQQEVAVAAWQQAEAIKEKPRSLYAETRSGKWKSPFANAKVKKAMEAAAKELGSKRGARKSK